MMHARLAHGAERAAAVAALVDAWGELVIVDGRSYRFEACEIFVAGEMFGAGEMAGLAAVSLEARPIAELVAINAFERAAGVGTALLAAIVPALEGFRALRLTTTNDSLDALRFYQRRGFRLTALRPGAVDRARGLKPSIPRVGEYAIPLHDELELTLTL